MGKKRTKRRAQNEVLSSRKDRVRFIGACKRRDKDELRYAEKKVHDLQAEIANLQLGVDGSAVQIVEQACKIDGKCAMLEVFEKEIRYMKSSAFRQLGFYDEQWAAIHTVPRVRGCRMEDSETLVIVTDTLFGKETVGKSADGTYTWHLVGRFEIHFNLILGVAVWKNTSGFYLKERGSAYYAPQIPATGKVGCMGEADGVLDSAYSRRAYGECVAVLVRFAECEQLRNDEGMYPWPRVARSQVPQWYLENFPD